MATDILILGLSKTGTTAISQAIWRAFDSRPTLHQEPTTFGQPGGRDAAWHARQCGGRGVVTKCLVFPELDTEVWQQLAEVAAHYSHCIWIDRDPRDRLISHTLYGWYRGHGRRITDRAERTDWHQKFEQTLDKVQLKETDPLSVDFVDLLSGWWLEGYLQRFKQDQQRLYSQVCQQREQALSGSYLLRYEDFIDGKLEGLEMYLGRPVSNDITVKLRQKRVARTRSYGDWRHWFTQRDMEILSPLYGDYLQLAYGSQDWQLSERAHIEPAHGSEYLKKIHGQFAF